MKKIYSLFAALALCMSVFAATETTVYYSVPAATVGTYTVKLNVNRSGNANNWVQYDMTLTGKTYNSNPIYTCTFTDLWDGLGAIQFQLYDGETWISQVQPFGEQAWTSPSVYNGKMWVHGGSTWVDYTYDSQDPYVHLEASASTVEPNANVTLTATAGNFSGAITYTYSYSTDGGANYTQIETPTSSNSKTFQVGTTGSYKFKVVATYDTEEAQATTDVHLIVCTVVGSSESIFGTAWAPTLAANDMDYNAGVYTWEKSAVYLPAGTIEYKVALNHAWDVTYPNGLANKTLEITDAGYYDLAFTFTWADREEDGNGISAEATFLYPHLIQIAGDFNGWAAAQMTTSLNKLTCSSTIALTAGDTVEFKIYSTTGASSAWLGNNGKMVRNNCSGWAMEEDKSNCRIFADETGDYTFTWVYGTGVLSVTYPNTYTRNFANVQYGTICLPAAAELSNAKVYTVSAVSNSQITIVEKANTNVEAGHPYVIKPLVAGNVVATFDGTLPVSDAVNDYLYGNIGTEPIVLHAADNAYILTGGEFRPVIDGGEGVTVGLYRAYLKMENAQGAPALRIVEVANDATNIQNIEGYEVAVKFIENGQLYILKDGVVYTAAGVAVK